jgi:hypothetical protein
MENVAYHNDPVCVPVNYAIREILETWNSSCELRIISTAFVVSQKKPILTLQP